MTVHDSAARREEYPDDSQTGAFAAAMDHLSSGFQGMVGLMSDDSRKVRVALDAMVQRIDALAHQVASLSLQVREAEERLGNTMLSTAARYEQEAIGRQQDLQRQLGMLGSSQQQKPLDHDDDAVRALIAAERQLAVVASNVGDHFEVIDGQRANLRDSLFGLGVRAIEPELAAAFDRDRYRSDAQMRSTTDPALAGTVAEVITVGWERADGTSVVELASVRVFDYLPTTVEPASPTATAPKVGEPASTQPQAEEDPSLDAAPAAESADAEVVVEPVHPERIGSSGGPVGEQRPRPPQPARHAGPDDEVYDQLAEDGQSVCRTDDDDATGGAGRPGGKS